MLSLVEIGSVALERTIIKFYQYIFILLFLYPIGKWRGVTTHLKNIFSKYVNIGHINKYETKIEKKKFCMAALFFLFKNSKTISSNFLFRSCHTQFMRNSFPNLPDSFRLNFAKICVVF